MKANYESFAAFATLHFKTWSGSGKSGPINKRAFKADLHVLEDPPDTLHHADSLA